MVTVLGQGRYTEYRITVDGSIQEVIDADDGQDGVDKNYFDGLNEERRTSFDGVVTGNEYDRFSIDGEVASMRNHNNNAPAVYENYHQLFQD